MVPAVRNHLSLSDGHHPSHPHGQGHRQAHQAEFALEMSEAKEEKAEKAREESSVHVYTILKKLLAFRKKDLVLRLKSPLGVKKILR